MEKAGKYGPARTGRGRNFFDLKKFFFLEAVGCFFGFSLANEKPGIPTAEAAIEVYHVVEIFADFTEVILIKNNSSSVEYVPGGQFVYETCV